jgi:esterase/lipase superfamily enzyme
MQERYIKWWTPYLSREFEMLVFGNGGGLPLIIFPTSFGNYRQNKDFGVIDSVAWFVDNNRVTIYCPDSIDLDSFYNRDIHPADRIRTHIAYENVIVRDVFDFARREGSTHRVGVCGASLGAYHAGQYCLQARRYRQSSHQPERRLRDQRFLRRLPRRQHLFQQPLRISAENARPVEVQPHEHHSRDRRMG